MAVTYQSQASATPSSGTSITVAKPAGTVEGDVLVALMVAITSSSSGDISAPAGWLSAGSGAVAAPPGFTGRGLCAYRVTGASEPANYTFTRGDAISAAAGVILRYAPQAPTAPPGVVDAVGMSGQVTPGVAPSVDAAGNADTLITWHISRTTEGATPTGMTQRALISLTDIKLGCYDELLSSPGATGTRTWTGSSNARSWSILLFAEQAGSRIRMMV